MSKWFLALYLLTQQKNGISALELKRHLGVSCPTAWSIKHKLLQVTGERDAGRKLSGIIQLDDVYWGGERPGGKPGRGSRNKVPFIAAAGFEHQPLPTGGGPAIVELPWVNTLIGNVKNAMRGGYPKASGQHLPR